MAGTTGLEPATSAVTGQRSNQLSYVPSAISTRMGNMQKPELFRFSSLSGLIHQTKQLFEASCLGSRSNDEAVTTSLTEL
jgi:hypothetical protein